MRKTSYFITFLAVSVTLFLNVMSIIRPDWLYVHTPDIFNTKTIVRYGLFERCERKEFSIPSPDGSGQITYSNYTCRPFPKRQEDKCEDGYEMFCMLWTTAGYSAELSVVFGASALVGILAGVSTRSRRRRVWRACAGLESLHCAFKIISFAIITDVYQKAQFPYFEYARPSAAYVLNVVSWVLDVFIIFGVLVTGISAEAGHAWAAGNRAYRPIENH